MFSRTLSKSSCYMLRVSLKNRLILKGLDFLRCYIIKFIHWGVILGRIDDFEKQLSLVVGVGRGGNTDNNQKRSQVKFLFTILCAGEGSQSVHLCEKKIYCIALLSCSREFA